MHFPAHIRANGTAQSVQEHCRNTAHYAAQCLRPIGLGSTAQMAGLVHDCGKFKDEFVTYLKDPHGVRGSVNHSFSGCRLLLERYHTEQSTPMERLTAELIAFAVGSHHGLFDCVDEDKQSGFLHRMTKENIFHEESKRNFLRQCADDTELDALFAASVEELSALGEALSSDDGEESCFQLSLLARLVLSALIEGDRRDTAEFMEAAAHPSEEAHEQGFWARYLQAVEEKLAQFPTDTPICAARRSISDRCRAFAENKGGIYRLNVPTGGGKTLSSLRYALAHAEKWGKQRIIFTSPLLSILEQNAAVIRSFVGDDGIILEHHSNVLHTENEAEAVYRELAVESWNKPIILTTLVQLLNTLFDGKSTSIRRFQGLCKSVIVIDEVQTVPPKMLSLFHGALSFLANICDATVLLCSATQPCSEKAAHPIRAELQDMIPFDPKLWAPFRRTRITDIGQKPLEEIAQFASEELEQVQSLLVICNRKDEAEFFFSRMRQQAEHSCHLSASMCMAHRREVLERLNAALAAGKKCLCIATQVIEAGVDISFARVIRLAAGMDSVIQAAGRCNRHGEAAEAVPVYVVSCEGEQLSRLPEIQAGKHASLSLLNDFRRAPDRFDFDLASEAAIRTYYQKLYKNMPEGYQDYPLAQGTSIFSLMGYNLKYFDENAAYADQFVLHSALKTAGSAFEVFDSSTRNLIVPYGRGAELISELTRQSRPDSTFLADWSRRAKSYCISIYDWQRKALGNAIKEYAGATILAEGYYDEDTGLSLRQTQNMFMEV